MSCQNNQTEIAVAMNLCCAWVLWAHKSRGSRGRGKLGPTFPPYPLRYQTLNFNLSKTFVKVFHFINEPCQNTVDNVIWKTLLAL